VSHNQPENKIHKKRKKGTRQPAEKRALTLRNAMAREPIDKEMMTLALKSSEGRRGKRYATSRRYNDVSKNE